MKKTIALLSATSLMICGIYITKTAVFFEGTQDHKSTIFTPFYENVAWRIIDKTPYSQICDGSKMYLYNGIKPFVEPVRRKLRSEALAVYNKKDIAFLYCRKTAIYTKENLEKLRNDIIRVPSKFR